MRRARRIAFRTPRKLGRWSARTAARRDPRRRAGARGRPRHGTRSLISCRTDLHGGGDAGVRTRRRDERATMVTMNTRTRSFCARRRVHLIRTHTHAPLRALASSSISSYPTVSAAQRRRGPRARGAVADGGTPRRADPRSARWREPPRAPSFACPPRSRRCACPGRGNRGAETWRRRWSAPQCRHATARRSVHPAEAPVFRRRPPMMLLQMSATVNTATNGQNGATAATAAGNGRLSVSPPSMGRSTRNCRLAMRARQRPGNAVPAGFWS